MIVNTASVWRGGIGDCEYRLCMEGGMGECEYHLRVEGRYGQGEEAGEIVLRTWGNSFTLGK